MIGLDTNILVRYITQDDVAQSILATNLIESLTVDEPGFVPLVVIVELSWVLSSSFGLNRAELAQTFETLARARELVLERRDIVDGALRLFANSRADFADCLIERSSAAAGCDVTMTFDRRAASECGMALLA